MNTLTLNLAVVGAGPIGLFLGIKLARQGHRVTLYEKKSLPIDKVCGQGIMPSGVKLLKELGLDFRVGEDCYEFDSIHYIDGNKNLRADLPEKSLGMERIVLSEKLFSLAKKTPNLSIIENTAFHLKEQEYDYVFACDGLNSSLREQLNNTVLKKNKTRLGARVHCLTKPWSSSVEVHWNSGVEAYVTPVSNNKVEVAFLWFEGAVSKGAHLQERLFDLFPTLARNVQNDFKAYGPFSHSARKLRVGNVFFVGDAYHFIDGITGEGLSLGFKTANLVAAHFQNFGPWPKLKHKLYYFNYALWVKLALALSVNLKLRAKVFQIGRVFFKYILRLNDL